MIPNGGVKAPTKVAQTNKDDQQHTADMILVQGREPSSQPGENEATDGSADNYRRRTTLRSITNQLQAFADRARNSSGTPTDKTTWILIAIVLMFAFTRSYRISLGLYEVTIPRSVTEQHYMECLEIGRYMFT